MIFFKTKLNNMKLTSQTFILVFASAIIFSCKKDEVKIIPLASINVINAVNGGTAVKLGSNSTTISSYNNNGTHIPLHAGSNDLYVWPVGDSLHPYYTQTKFNAEERAVYSLFLCGVPGAVEGILQKETIPYRTDSTCGIRFINLAPASSPLNITLATTPTVNEASNLAYKQMTEFRSYPSITSTAPYSFQIRNASTNAVITTYAFNNFNPIPRFSNITLVIRQSGTGVAVFRVNNDR